MCLIANGQNVQEIKRQVQEIVFINNQEKEVYVVDKDLDWKNEIGFIYETLCE